MKKLTLIKRIRKITCGSPDWTIYQHSPHMLCAGSGMVIVGCGLLFWNEGRAVKTAVSLEGESFAGL